MIIFDNENLAVLNKRNGYSVQGGLNPKFNLYSLMSSKYKK
jgi:23S rRNA-/tRNA-specific pseudouridylate synthase